VALVHRTGLRSADSAPLYIFQEPHGRFQESNLFREIFEEIVARCVEAGLVKGEHMSVDGSFIQANADHHSRVPREQLAEIAKVNHTVREYLVELERENPVEPPVAQQEKVSTTDPNSIYATKGGPARLGYYDNYPVDNDVARWQRIPRQRRTTAMA